MSLFSVLTVNVRGMRNGGKRGCVFQYLSQVSFQVCFLQEVHLRDGGDVGVFSGGWLKGESRWGVGGGGQGVIRGSGFPCFGQLFCGAGEGSCGGCGLEGSLFPFY